MTSSPIAIGTTNTTPGSIQIGQTPRIGIQRLTISQQGIDFIKAWENLKLYYYNDHFKYCTVGWGHLVNGQHSCQSQGIVEMTPITIQQANAWFDTDKSKHENLVRDAIHVPLFQREFDALCSLAYNVGSIDVVAPSLCRKINAGQYTVAADQLLDITNGGVGGLITRRHQEREMYLNGDYSSEH